MRLALIGMAGAGKTYWAKRLAGAGFKHICCDDLIAAQLASELKRSDGTGMKMGKWMGFPFESLYKERAAKYFAYEQKVLAGVLEYLEGRGQDSEKIVVDTTGSVIYTGDKLLNRLKQSTTIVFLSTPPEAQVEMLRAYLASPGPMLWMDEFSKKPNESDQEALARCYPRLLFFRERLYAKYADVAIDHSCRRKKGFGAAEFLAKIEETRKGC